MKSDRDRTSQPRLEVLEDRSLPSAASLLFRSHLGPLPHRGAVASLGGSGTPGAVRTITNPGNAARFTVTIVPRDSSPVSLSQPGTTTIQGVDGGIFEPGLPNTTTLGLGGLTTPGLPSFAPSQPVTTPSIQPGGLVISPNGSVSGSLFM
jgi:hypothetical protein